MKRKNQPYAELVQERHTGIEKGEEGGMIEGKEGKKRKSMCVDDGAMCVTPRQERTKARKEIEIKRVTEEVEREERN